MDNNSNTNSCKSNMMDQMSEEEESEDEVWDSDDDAETIARIQRAHYAATAAMNARRRAPARSRPMSQKRKLEAVRTFHDFTKKLKKDTGIRIRSLGGSNILDLSDFSNEDSKSDSDGLSEPEFDVNPGAVEELNGENESYIDPFTGDFVEAKNTVSEPKPSIDVVQSECEREPVPEQEPEPELEPEEDSVKTLSISDILNGGDLDLSKNVEIAEVEGSELCTEKEAAELLNIKDEETSQDYDVTEKLKEMGEISEKPADDAEPEENKDDNEAETKPCTEEEKKTANPNALNVRRNIREVMDEKNLDASTLAAQRQESERLARVQEQQRIIREVQRQIAINRQNKIHQKTLSLLQGGSSILKKGSAAQKLNLPNTVLVKLPSGEVRKTGLKPGQVDLAKLSKPVPSGSALKSEQKAEKKEVVEIVDSSSGEETSSSSSDSDDCIMLSDSEVPPSPEAEEDPNNSGLHVNDTYNVPDEQGRVLINLGHPETEEDIFLAPQIARIIKPHQIGGVRFLFDNIIESVERFSTSTGFGCILAHSMGLGKTLQIVCFCDIFLRHTTFKTVLCIMPINTLQNWVAEFNMWLPVDAAASPLSAHGKVRPRNFPIYVLNDSHKTLQMRAKVVKDWSTTGGVLMIGYELFRLLSMKKDKKPRKKKKGDAKNEEKEKEDKKNETPANQQGSDGVGKTDDKPEDGSDPTKPGESNEVKKDEPIDEEKRLLDEMYEALVKPGPDLVICDEGHRIKNSHSNISYALKQMRTKRRVVLTGYPLQNNLLEYWCMVDFVRPNYLGSKTEFCNMFERPIQNGQCIDSTPQDIRLMRYRAHVLHSLLVGFVQRRSHLVLQSTLPQKEEYVLLVRMTPLQRKLYEQFMNEVVRSTSVPNPLKAFAICCKIWNHPDVLYNFLKKRSEVNALIEEDLDLEEIGGVTKAGRARNSKAQPRRAAKPRGAGKKPAATIPPNTTAGPLVPRQETGSFNTPYPQNGPYGPQNSYRNDQAGSYPPYSNYPNAPYYPPNSQNPGYTPNYDSNYYQQQTPQPPYGNDYPNQFPTQNPDGQNYNQNYWGNGSNYFNNPGYFNNQYPNNQPSQNYPPPTGEFSNSQQYPPNYNTPNSQGTYPANTMPPYQDNQNGYGNQQRPPFQGQYPPGYDFNTNTPQGSQFPNNEQPRPTQYPNANPSGSSYSDPQYPNNQTPGTQYPNTAQTGPQFPKTTPTGPQYPGVPSTGPQYPNGPQTEGQYPNVPPATQVPQYPENATPRPEYPNQSYGPEYGPPNAPYDPNNSTFNQYNNRQQNYPFQANPAIKQEGEIKTEQTAQNQQNAPYGTSGYNYNQSNPACYPNPNETNYPGQYTNFSMETKPPLGSAGSGSPLPTWPLTEPLKTELDKIKAEEKSEIKSESDGEVKIADLDTKTIVKNDLKKELEKFTNDIPTPIKEKNAKDVTKTDASESEDEAPKKGRRRKGKEPKKERQKPGPKPKPGSKAAKARKDRKTSKEKNDDSESEESEKEEKLSREEAKKAEEMTYDWAAELLKDYIPGIIENSAKMELFFYLLNESIKLGDRILLFSQSLFTLNLIEDFLEKNYVPGTNLLWQRNTNYYRLDGSTHALEREKLINEFNSNPHIYLFLVSTRAGSLGINLVGANRVIVFDASWNPCHDTQAVCRVYRYGQRKPCFVYRFVMDCCLEKKIYDRQINKQGMADRVVDECNPDAVLSMKEITNLCFDNDEKETEIKDLSEHKDKYIDILMQGIIQNSWKLLTKEPFQHESLLVDRKEKKLSSAEKRLAQRGYELEKKAALAPKPTTAYRTVRTADGSLVQRPVASVRPMQQTARWIPADVWRRQGMTAQEMTLPLDVVIPTNSAEKTNIVLKAGQRVMVLKSPKGIYMQLESGKIIAIKTSLKGMTQKADGKDNPLAKKILGGRPSTAALPGSLKNNSAITITSKAGSRPPGLQRLMSRPNMLGGQSKGRLLPPGQRLVEIRNRLGDMKSYSNVRPKLGKLLRPALPGSVSITKITKDPKKPEEDARIETESEETHVLDSDDEDTASKDSTDTKTNSKEPAVPTVVEDKTEDRAADSSKSSAENEQSPSNNKSETETKPEPSAPLVLTTDEKLPTEEALEKTTQEENSLDLSKQPMKQNKTEKKMLAADTARAKAQRVENKINLLKNYRHQRQAVKPPDESSLSQLARTASALNTEGLPDFRKNLDDITQSYSPSEEMKPTKSRKKKSPTKIEAAEPTAERPLLPSSNTSHSVSSLLGSGPKNTRSVENIASVPPIGPTPRVPTHNLPGMSPEIPQVNSVPSGMSEVGKPPMFPGHQSIPGGMQMGTMPPGPYPSNPQPDGSYAQYPGYGMGYGAYPSAPYGYGAYAGAPYYPPYGAPPGPAPTYPPAPTPEGYLPPNPQW